MGVSAEVLVDEQKAVSSADAEGEAHIEVDASAEGTPHADALVETVHGHMES